MRYAFFLFVLAFALIMIPFSSEAAAGAAEGARLFSLTVLPSLFPFIVCANYLAGRSRSLLSHSKVAFLKHLLTDILAAVCGTPSSAILMNEANVRGEYDLNTASMLCAVMNQAGPTFIVSAFSIGMLESPSYAPFLALSHYLPPLFFSLAFGLIKNRTRTAVHSCDPDGTNVQTSISDAVSKAVTAILRIGGTIVFFRTVFAVADQMMGTLIIPTMIKGFIFGSVEMTNGLSVLASERTRLSVSLCSFLLSFGGYAIYIQSKMLFPKLKAGRYFAVKAASGCISAILTWFLFPVIPDSQAVFGSLSEEIGGVLPRIGSRCLVDLSFISAFSASLVFSALYAVIVSGKGKDRQRRRS